MGCSWVGGWGRARAGAAHQWGGLIPTARGQEGPAAQCGCRCPGRTHVSGGQKFFTDGENKESGQTCPPGSRNLCWEGRNPSSQKMVPALHCTL